MGMCKNPDTVCVLCEVQTSSSYSNKSQALRQSAAIKGRGVQLKPAEWLIADGRSSEVELECIKDNGYPTVPAIVGRYLVRHVLLGCIGRFC
jgi:hypothetical protein